MELPQNYSTGAIFSLQVIYQTTPTSPGATFLTPEQTLGGVSPFFYTYSYMVNGRGFAPQQDTPANRITWGGCITTNSTMSPYMSGNKTNTFYAAPGLYKTCYYQMIPAPNYLMNVVVGNLTSQSMGDNTIIVAEPAAIGTAVSEYSDMQALLDTTEYWVQTPYIWGDYTLVVMPPAFPEGGMSNPNLNYISATTLVGDKSQQFVILREMVQSWTGNQVTPDNWEDYWLNEGITTFVERQVQSLVDGVTYYFLESFVGNNSLVVQTAVIGLPDKTYVTLHPVLHGANPDETYNIVPFEKGFQFIDLLNNFILGAGTTQDLITYYINANSLTSINAFTGFRKSVSNFIEGGPYTNERVN